jgi:hypothetical protein
MNRPRTGQATSLLRLFTFLVLAGLVAVFVPESTATPNIDVSPVQTKVERERVNCEDGGGRFYESTNALGTAASTLCVDGTTSDVACTHTIFSFECQAVRTNPADGPDIGVPETAENVSETVVAGPSDTADTQVAWDPTGTTGDATDPRIDLMTTMCRELGGIETRSTTTTSDGNARTDAFLCQGGEFDAFGCVASDAGAWCAFGLIQVPEGDAISPDETIALPAITDLTVPSATAAELGTDVDIVVYNQHGTTVYDNAVTQVLVCRMLGGQDDVTSDRTTGSGLRGVTVRCVGGVVGDWVCVNIAGFPTVCGARMQTPDSPVITPVPEQEQPVDLAPTPTAPVTVTPTEPATAPSPTATVEPTVPPVEPTEVPVEPTAEPTVVFPTLSVDPVNPPDTAEQPTVPTPTFVPIG